VLHSRSASSTSPRANFRKRYAAIETRRAELVARLGALDQRAQDHPGYKRALKLLNNTFCKEKLAQRFAVLHAATWPIDVLEKLSTIS